MIYFRFKPSEISDYGKRGRLGRFYSQELFLLHRKHRRPSWCCAISVWENKPSDHNPRIFGWDKGRIGPLYHGNSPPNQHHNGWWMTVASELFDIHAIYNVELFLAHLSLRVPWALYVNNFVNNNICKQRNLLKSTDLSPIG